MDVTMKEVSEDEMQSQGSSVSFPRATLIIS